MAYFSYHAVARRLIAEGRLRGYRIVPEYRGIRPALLLLFDDDRHPVMPIREHRFSEYLPLLEAACAEKPGEGADENK
ncbi:MAG: thermostable hemolysin delta-VPH [Clostridia bacterium]|nr:thermostable hemolysin delta-VPH [Clostridia bacterium]